MARYKLYLKPLARRLRKNMTESERLLWSRIRRKTIKGKQFYRQRPIGTYIVDFYCPSGNLVIEVDGSQHLTPEMIEADKKRDAYLNSIGLKVLRFSSREVMKDLDGVLMRIHDNLIV